MSEPITETATEPTGDAPQAAQPKETDWEAEARKWEKRSKDNFAKLKDAEPKLAEYERILEASKTVEQRQADELARLQSEAERWRTASVTSRIEALAANDFQYPSDAVSKLDPAKYLGPDGQINEAAIKADLEAVLAERPKWRRQDEAPSTRLPWPNPAQGASAGAPSNDPNAQMNALIRSARGL